MRLKFNVRAQQIFRADRIPLASDSRLYIAATAVFDSEWDDITARWLTFEPRTGTAITAVLADGSSFEESLGVSLSAGTWRVSAHGTNSAGKEIHTTPVLLNVTQAGGRDGEAPPYVPPDAAGQVMAVASEAREIAQSVRDDADAGKFKGEKGDAFTYADFTPEQLASLKGATGAAGQSAYAAAQAGGYTDTEANFYADLAAMQGLSGGQVQTDWNQNDATAKDYIKNRPGGYETGFEITWDGDTTGRVSATAEGMPFVWYKVSDKTLTANDIIGGTVTVVQNGVSRSLVLTSDAVVREDYGVITSDGLIILAAQQGTYVSTMGGFSISIPETGVYFAYMNSAGTTVYSASLSNIIVHPFDDKYIPDSIARKDEVPDISLGVSEAAVKNLMQVTAIDGDGRPTAWNTVAPDKAVVLTSTSKCWMLGVNDNGDISGIDITASYVGINETITDSWEEIIAACADGTYSTKYSVGDTKLLNLGSEGFVAMQIAAFDADTLADGSGKAPISWISEQLLKTSHRMNPSRVTNDDGTYQEGTGGIGGWEKSEMRSYLIDTIKPLIPSSVSSAIKSVTKTQPALSTSGSSFTQTTTDDVWIPSYSEMFTSSSLYFPLFQNTAANRIKKTSGSTSASNWWLRSAYEIGGFYGVGDGGGGYGGAAGISDGIALGFCT